MVISKSAASWSSSLGLIVFVFLHFEEIVRAPK